MFAGRLRRALVLWIADLSSPSAWLESRSASPSHLSSETEDESAESPKSEPRRALNRRPPAGRIFFVFVLGCMSIVFGLAGPFFSFLLRVICVWAAQVGPKQLRNSEQVTSTMGHFRFWGPRKLGASAGARAARPMGPGLHPRTPSCIKLAGAGLGSSEFRHVLTSGLGAEKSCARAELFAFFGPRFLNKIGPVFPKIGPIHVCVRAHNKIVYRRYSPPDKAGRRIQNFRPKRSSAHSRFRSSAPTPLFRPPNSEP